MKNLIYVNLKILGINFKKLLLVGVIIFFFSFFFRFTPIFMIIVYLLLASAPLLYIFYTVSKENMNWKKIEATMPITKRNIVFSKYVTYIVTLLISLIMAGVFCLGSILNGSITWDVHFTGLIILGVAIVLSIFTFFYPLFLALGEKKAELSMLMAFFLSIFPLRLFMEIIKRYLVLEDIAELHQYAFFYNALIILILFFYTLSCVISIYLYKHIEL